MLGIEHIASRGSIMLEYYGRNVGVKIMPTGVDPSRFQQGFSSEDTKWRQGELVSQVLIISPRRSRTACLPLLYTTDLDKSNADDGFSI